MKLTPREAMTLAIEEGRQGAGFVAPNPLVGCVILDRDGGFLAKGYHARLGDLHAETAALQTVHDPRRLEGAHVFVTLEPCAHQGRQPSCAQTLAKLPIASVTYGLEDPDPRVSGRGHEILAKAGIRVTRFDELREELEDLAEIFLVNQRAGRAFVTLKLATSLDGRVALANGESQWITGESARGHVQSLRGFHDAVLTGAGTVLRDDPRLNSRDPRFAGKPQRLVVLDVNGETSARLPTSRLLEVRRPEDIVFVTGPGVRAPEGVTHLEFAVADGEIALKDLLARLRASNVHSVFLEAGGRTASSFLRQGLVDRLLVFMAPRLLGNGRGWTEDLEIPSLDRAVGLRFSRVERFGEDLLMSLRPDRRS